MWTRQQMKQGFLGSGPGSNSVLLPGNRKRGHEPGQSGTLCHIAYTEAFSRGTSIYSAVFNHPDRHYPVISNRIIHKCAY